MNEQPQSKTKRIVWNIAFGVMYPFITVFSLFFTAILRVFSFISWGIVAIIQKFRK